MGDIYYKKGQSGVKEITEHYFNITEYLESELEVKSRPIPESSTTRKYFEDGREIETEDYRNGKLDQKTSYKYNGKNQLIEVVELDFSEPPLNTEHLFKGKLKRKIINIYNEKDLLIEELEFDSSENPFRKSVCSYYPNGLIKEEIVYYDMEHIDFKLFFTYDKNLRFATQAFWHYEDNDESVTTYEYLNDGKEQIETYRDISGKLIEKIIYVYDDNGNLLQSKYFDENGDLERNFLFAYDDFNNRISKELWCFENNKIVQYLKEETEYFYDAANNWIKAIYNAEEEEYSRVIIREIIYY